MTKPELPKKLNREDIEILGRQNLDAFNRDQKYPTYANTVRSSFLSGCFKERVRARQLAEVLNIYAHGEQNTDTRNLASETLKIYFDDINDEYTWAKTRDK